MKLDWTGFWTFWKIPFDPEAYDQTQEARPPRQKALVFAALTCYFSLLLSYLTEGRVVNYFDLRWAAFWVYSVLPLALTFCVLYRSCWHREVFSAGRMCLVLFLSVEILLCVWLATGALFVMTWYGLNAMSGGFHP